jgi:hypothetical protein
VSDSKPLFRFVIVIAFGCCLCGCLYLKHGETETINVQSEPSGAQVVVNGTPYGTTPTDVTLSRCQDYQATLSKGGYSPANLDISRGTKPIEGLDSFLLFCDSVFAPALLVDQYFCAVSQFSPNPVSVTLLPASDEKSPGL